MFSREQDTSTYGANAYNQNGNGSSFMMPFFMGMAVGMIGSALYAAARNEKFGPAVAEKIEHIEDKAIDIKNKVADKAHDLTEAAKEKLHIGENKADRAWDATQTAAANMADTADRETDRIARAVGE